MKKSLKLFSLFFSVALFFTACSSNKNFCKAETQKIWGAEPGFKITKVKVYDANTLKLFLGKHHDITNEVVEVYFSTDKKDNNSAYFLFDSDNKLLNKGGQIEEGLK